MLAAQLRLRRATAPRRADPPDVLAEVDQDGRGSVPIWMTAVNAARRGPPAGAAPGRSEVGAARDRQELGQSLEHAEEDGLEEVEHGAALPGFGPGRPAQAYARAPGRSMTAPRRGVDPAAFASIASPHAAALPGPDRPQGLPAGARHPHLGARHRRARGPRPADRVHRGRRHPRRHRGRLRRRRLRGADRLAHRRRRGPRRPRHRHQGRHQPGSRRPRDERLPRLPDLRTLDASLQPARRRPRRPVAGAHAGSTTPRSRRR